MSSEVAIRVSGLGKCYHIYDKPQHRLLQMLARGRKRFFREFWALDDVSFEVRRGETVGIIGRNGSGKSTLLQLICDTLAPTRGDIEVNGRVAALLELGAGFNPEFTGRENVYVNATLLGLSRAEINARIDDILAFADIGDFVDQPVKVYSSGMYVRLAFAVAVNAVPEVLVVDEALSVGDLAFQNKCIMKIKELRDRGTTLLFVTHDLSTLQLICDRVIWLHRGKIVTIGEPVTVSQEYYVGITGAQTGDRIRASIVPQKATGMASILAVGFADAINEGQPVFQVGDDIVIRFAVRADAALGRSVFTVSVFRADGDWILGQTSLEAGVFWPACGPGETLNGALILRDNCFAPGDYLVAIGANSEDLSVCYALSDLTAPFSVRWNYPTWGRFIHPCDWLPG